MTAETHAAHGAPDHADGHHGDHDGHAPGHGTMRDYVIGFAASVVLTALAFGLVMTGALPPIWTGILVSLLAIVQILVHTKYFLHVDTRLEGGWSLMAMTFTMVIVLIVILGSLWIMYHLHGNMMPMEVAPTTAEQPAATPMPAPATLP